MVSIILAVFFLATGIPYFLQSRSLFSEEIPYFTGTQTDPVLTKTFHISESVDGPVYVFYKLDKFYQNHRRFVTSRDYEQLRNGASLGSGAWKGFLLPRPVFVTFISLYVSVYVFVCVCVRIYLACDYRIREGQAIPHEGYCGIAYASRFNDKFTVSYREHPSDDLSLVSIDDSSIVTSSDKVLTSPFSLHHLL